MASTITLQDGLRAYPMFDHVPAGCIAFAVADAGSEPVLHFGEFVIVDQQQRQPVHGELFVIEHGRNVGRPRRVIVETWQREMRSNGGTVRTWWTGPYARPRTAAASQLLLQREHRVVCCDGPYADEGAGADYLPSKIVGRIVGVYQATFDEAALRTVS